MREYNDAATSPTGCNRGPGRLSRGGICAALLLSLVLACCPVTSTLGGEFGEYPSHTNMPPVPTDPARYQAMWDPFVLRESSSKEPLQIAPESTDGVRLLSEFDGLPWNGRQIVRDGRGNWYVAIEQTGHNIFLATGIGSADNPYRPRGGDLAVMKLVGSGADAVLPARGQVNHASMAVDADNHLHVIWHAQDGLWHAQARLPHDAPAPLRENAAWTAPRRLVESSCRPGDVMVDADGQVAVSYSRDDTVYYQSVSGAAPEVVAGPDTGMPSMQRLAGSIPMSQRESQDAVMDLAPDGSVHLAFRRDFAIWVTRRTPEGQWQPAERVAREYAFHPSIMIANGRPLVTFLHEGIRRIPLDLAGNLRQRAGGGPAIGYATLNEDGWRTGSVVRAEEIAVFRRGMWADRHSGRLLLQIEQLGRPVMFRDRHGVVWTLWQNTTRRWAYSTRWMGEQFGHVHECRGPFNAPALSVCAEKYAPPDADDVGLLFCAAAAGGNDRPIFDRLRVPSLSVAEDREVLFLDSLEVGATQGVDFVLNRMHKPGRQPALAPRESDTGVWSPSVTRHGDTYVMHYSATAEDGTRRQGVAVSRDGVHFDMVNELPDDLPEAEQTPTRPLAYWKGGPVGTAPQQYENPDQTDPAKKYMRLVFSTEDRGTYRVEYSPDGRQWTDGAHITATEAMRENARPGFFNPTDPERPIRIYSRVYTETGRSWGVIWSRDLVNWSGLEHLLDPDDPYGTEPAQSAIGTTGKNYTMRGQVYLDSVAGKGEDEIYATSVRFAEGLYFCFYWPGTTGRPLTDVGLAVSRDGFNFTRVKNGERVLPLGPPGAWDAGYIFQMYPMLDGDIVRVFYRGTAGRREGSDGFRHNLTEIGVATIRVNGWTYYTPRSGQDRATVTTIPIQSPAQHGKALEVNLEGVAGKAGAFGVEVLDAATREPLEGFGLADCIAPSEGGPAVPIAWRGGDRLPSGRDIRLRFYLRDPAVRLYSFGFRSDVAGP